MDVLHTDAPQGRPMRRLRGSARRRGRPARRRPLADLHLAKIRREKTCYPEIYNKASFITEIPTYYMHNIAVYFGKFNSLFGFCDILAFFKNTTGL